MLNNHTQRSSFRSRTGMRVLALSGALLTMGTLGGCDNAGEGLFTGAALGAVTGLVIGSANGEAGEGAALGAVIGAVAGSIIGDQNEERRQNAMYGSYEYRRSSGYRSDHPYCSTHRVYHSHSSRYRPHPPRRPHGHGYGYSEWWND